MARAGLSHDAVVGIALDLVDAGGPTGFADLTLAKVAAQAGVATPSLYKHVGSLAALRREVAVLSVEDYTRALTDATVGLAGPDAVAALAHATRQYARAHPGRYAAVQVAPTRTTRGRRAVGGRGRSVQVVAAVLRGFDLPRTARWTPSGPCARACTASSRSSSAAATACPTTSTAASTCTSARSSPGWRRSPVRPPEPETSAGPPGISARRRTPGGRAA